MEKNKRYIVTAALPYANGLIHIGHLAGVYIPADIFTRYLRLKKKDVIFICGSDEHGVPIIMRAQKDKVNPQKIVDNYHYINKNSFKKFGISFDNYSRTSSKIHYETVTNFFKNLNKKNNFIKKYSKQYYDNFTKQFLSDRYILGKCPNCNNNNAYGDQCEKCGISINPEELINPRSSVNGKKIILKKTKHWYIDLKKYEDFLKNWIINENSNNWKKNVFYQAKSWIDKGLKSRCITRDLNWGVPVPIKEAKGKVLYVWFDAPIGYISSTIEWGIINNKKWENYWKNKNTSLIHFIGKDNIFFHCIIFPIMLKAHGEYILPKNIPANEFLNLENKKISTSRNWAVWLNEFLDDFPNQEDALRYILTINMPENKDNNFSWKNFQIRFNSEIISIFGNFIHRNLVILDRYFNNTVPKFDKLTNKDIKILFKIKKYPKLIGDLIEKYNFRDALNHIINLSRIGNKYLTEESPWNIYSNNPKRVKSIIYISLQIVGIISQVTEPFLPKISKILRKIINVSLIPWDEIIKKEILPSGHILCKPKIFLKKIEDDLINKQLNKLKL